MKKENSYEDNLLLKSKNPIPTQEIKIEGIGTVKVYGNWETENIIKRLLDSEAITG